jgi:hypothetical protein
VSKFVKECRREWKRLGVEDSIANEMAADLAADLEEAEAEGASIEEVLGSSAFDPRSFAAAWAAERGVIRPSTTTARPARKLIALAIIVATALALIGAAIAFLPTTSTHRVASVALHPALLSPPQTLVPPTHSTAVATVHTVGLLLLVAGVIGIVTTSAWTLWSRAGREGPDGSSYG